MKIKRIYIDKNGFAVGNKDGGLCYYASVDHAIKEAIEKIEDKTLGGKAKKIKNSDLVRLQDVIDILEGL